MSETLNDDDLDRAMQDWARHSIDTIRVPHFSVAEVAGNRAAPGGRPVLLSALAAAVVVLLVAAGLALQQRTERSAPPADGAAQCPTRLPATHTPTSIGAGSLFTHPVASMTACSYSTSTTRQGHLIAAVRLGRQLATRLARQINASSTTRHDPLLCLHELDFSVLVGRDDHGTAFPAVTLTPGCREISATNGATTRYLNAADSALRAVDQRVKAVTAPVALGAGTVFTAHLPDRSHHLTARQAWHHWAPKQSSIPADLSVRYGSLTGRAAVNPQVWAYVAPPGSCLSTLPLPRTARCQEWTLLDARTGNHIETLWQRVR